MKIIEVCLRHTGFDVEWQPRIFCNRTWLGPSCIRTMGRCHSAATDTSNYQFVTCIYKYIVEVTVNVVFLIFSAMVKQMEHMDNL